MFFQGGLQEGIAAALQQSKFVVCFVTDDQDESRLWEQDWLRDDMLAELVQNRAVPLRLQADSEEAGYLSAIVPLPKTPTVVIIKNGDLKEYIAAGIAKEEFVRRFRNALGVAPSASSQGAQPAAATIAVQAASATTPATQPLETLQGSESSGQHTPASSSESQQPALAPAAAPQQSRSALQERLARHEAMKKREAEEEAERRRQAKGKGRAEPEDEPENEAAAEEGAGRGNEVVAAKQAAQTYNQRQLEQRNERARILKHIEDDKAARRAREAERKAERQMAMEGAQQETPAGLTASKASPSSRRSEYCALQVRLLDGSTIRTRLPSGTRLRTEVRKWVDENREDGERTPYTFRLILTPLPNKNIDDTEEDQTLEALGLTPSATLVLVPVQNYSAAYGGSGGSLLSRLFGLIIGFFTGILAFFAKIFTGAQTPPSPPTAPEEHRMQNVPRSSSSGSGNSSRPEPPRERRIRGFRNADDDRDQQLYNGNSLNFEPRKDDDE